MGDLTQSVVKNSPDNLWSKARVLFNVLPSKEKIGKSRNLENLRIFDAEVMSPDSYVNQLNSVRGQDSKETDGSLPCRYKTTDRVTLNYLKNHDPCLPYSINTVHLQDPYRTLRRLEGFAVRDNSTKDMYRSRESTLRSRYNKDLLIRREIIPTTKNDDKDDKDDEKRESPPRNNFRTCLEGSEVSRTARQYCQNTTLHGLRYVGDSDLTIGERIFWVVSFTAALLTASYYIWFLYQKWTNTPIIISLSPESVPLSELPFPSITVCNMNNVKKTEAIRITKGDDLREKLLLEDFCNNDYNENNTVAVDVNGEPINWNNMLRFMINVSQPCTDMLYRCQWHGNQTDCERIFNPTMTDEGICCNFNSVDRKHLFYNPRDWSDLNMTFPFASIDWNPEIGYDKDVPPESIPWRPYGAGIFYGLTLILDAEIHEYYCSSTASVGFKMLLHNPVETPKIADFAFTITPGEETRVIVTPRISTASRSILSVPQKKRKCFFTFERKLRYYRTYTQRNCVLECEANFTQQICDCVQYYMPKSSNTPICGKKDDLCATKARRAMELNLYDDETTINELNVTETPSCNCWPGCFELSYTMEISQSKLVPTFNIDERYIKKNPKYFTENMAVVHLFFVESQFTKYVKNELFGFTDFLSSIGGLLGLFMGFSFLSFMEVVYFATIRLWCRVYRNKTNGTRTVLRVHPLDHRQDVVYPFTQ